MPECVVGAAMQTGFGYAFAKFSGRKYTRQDAAKDPAMGCGLGIADPEALVGEGAGLAGDGVRAAEAAAEDGGAQAAEAAAGDAAAGAEGAGAEGGCSFSGDTPVATTSGETPIDQVQVGDEVLAYDPATGTTGLHQVSAVWEHTDSVIEHLTINGESLATTPEHPFDTEEGGWVAAGDLQVGMHVREADGAWGVVQTITFQQHPETMYNLTVQQAHTYFVGDGQWLVHNQCAAGKGFNPFAGKTPAEMDKQFQAKGFEPRGPDPVNGKGGYVNPKTGRSFHIDPHNSYGEPPHVDVNRPRGYKGGLPKRKFPY